MKKRICDVCNTTIEGKSSVVKVQWVGKEYDFYLCESCKAEVQSKVPDYNPHDKDDHRLFKAILSSFNSRQK